VGEFDGNGNGEGSGGPDLGGSVSGQQQGNPAWAEFYEVVPQELHEKVTPLLQKWDQGVNKRFEQVHSEYAPWKEYEKNGITPDQVNMALNVLNTLQEKPEYVWKSLGDHYKFGQTEEPGVTGQGQGEPQDQEFHDPRFDTLQQNFNTLAEYITRQEQEKRAQQADVALEQELSKLRKDYGDFDERYVLSYMQAGMTGENAVKQYQEFEQRIRGSAPKPFAFLGGNSGGIPGSNTDVTKMNSDQARQYAIQMLRAAKQERDQ
jgi:hypothetical protein